MSPSLEPKHRVRPGGIGSFAQWPWQKTIPPHVINGLAVAAGIGLTQAPVLAVGPPGAAQAASVGAVCASLCHSVDRAGRAVRLTLAGGLLGSGTVGMVVAVAPVPWLLNFAIAALMFGACMTLAWGPRAAPLSFSVVLAIVFTLALPHDMPLLHELGWTLAGALSYAVWAHLSTLVLEPRYRTLALARAVGSSARLLASRAAVLEARTPVELEADRWSQIDEETRLAAFLQTARDLVASDRTATDRLDHVELLSRATELRDLLLTSRLDLDLLGEDDLAYEIRRRLAASLRGNAAQLADVERALAAGFRSRFDRVRASNAIGALLDERGLPGEDPRLRLLPAIASRQQSLIELIAAIDGLARGGRQEQASSQTELGQHIGDERWPVSEILRNFTPQSSVFRHALRGAAAISIAHSLSSALPWATHPHWIVLSVAVVLRGSFAQTLARRNERIVGTAAGCGLVVALATLLPDAALAPIVWVAAGLAHAYVNVRYTLTAGAATVMALLQTRAVAPIDTVVVIERIADTVIGAGFAWAVSYVLPSWSRRTLPGLLETTLGALRAYAESAPSLSSESPAQQRVLRERAYGALEAFIGALRLSRLEPQWVRPPLPPLLGFVDHAQSLMAHLSSLRLMLLRRAELLRGPDSDALLAISRARLAKRLDAEAEPFSVAPRIQPLHIELPALLIERAALPWLARRLNVAIYEADLAGRSARNALGLLRDRASLQPRARANA